MKINKFNLTILSSLAKYLSILLFLIFLLNPTNSYSTAINFSGTVSIGTDSGGEKYILYNKDGVPSKFYTNYLPPKGSYNNNVATEHPLEKCGVFNAQTINMIGYDCMVAIPPPCPSPFPTITCLNYQNVFEDANTKKLRPIDCAGKTDSINCLSTAKPYCHEVDNPVLGLNCKLPPCNYIENQVFRRPGINCMADCNDNTQNFIKDQAHFMEGFNCLKSCSTTSDPIPGNNCVFEFNNYVMPICTQARNPQGHPNKSFNKTSSNFKRRQDCIDYKDLPICASGESNSSKKCVNRCASESDAGLDLNCASPSYINSFCHYNPNTANCTKYSCHLLSPNELKQSNNAIVANENKSDQKGCITSGYLNFSYYQLNALGWNNFKTNYTLANKPCQSPDYSDTETIVKVLGSQYYNSSLSGPYPYLQKIIDNILAESGSTGNQKIIEAHTPTHEKFFESFIFDITIPCKYTNVSQKISCEDYLESKKAPNDCNSNGLEPTSTSCTESSTKNCYCGLPDQLYCYKTGINCNRSINQKYSVCSKLNTEASIAKPDSSASWFFKPALDPLAIREING
ncbi:MAG: hypothetical protein ACKO6C_05290, partial [Alphaproteobacteria bacterium]